MRTIRSLAALGLLAAPATALDTCLRLDYAQLQGDVEVTANGGTDAREWDTNDRIGLSWLNVLDLPLLQPHVGLSLAYERHEDTEAGLTSEYTVGLAEIVGGCRLTLLPGFLHAEGNASVGIGRATLDAGGQSDDGDWYGYGLGADIVGTLPIPMLMTLELGLGAGWRVGSSSDHNLGGTAYDIDTEGTYARAFIGATF